MTVHLFDSYSLNVLYYFFQKELESVAIANEQHLEEMKRKHSKELEAFNEQFEQLKYQKQQVCFITFKISL